jgi:PAS domain S-box-containing protein
MVLSGTRAQLRAQLAAIVEFSTDAILTTTPAGVITSWNRGAEQLYGYAAAEAIGQPVQILIPTEQADEFPEIMAHLRRGERVESYDTVRQHKDGHHIDVSITVSPLLARDRSLVGTSSIARDISECARASLERTAFIAALTHDIKTPLTTVQASAQLLQRDLERNGVIAPAVLTAGLGQVVMGTRRASRMLDALLDMARLRSGQPLALVQTICDLVALAQQAVLEQQRRADGYTLRVVSAEPAVVGRWDGERLARVVENLLSNAVKYSRPGSTVWVRVEREVRPPSALLVVEDQGLGIPAADLPYVFGYYYRGRNAAAAGDGSGLGLASARQIVEQHDGSIVLDSEEGRGTRVTVRLPIDLTPPSNDGHRRDTV